MKTKAKKEVLQKLREHMRKKGGDNMLGGMGVAVKAKDKKGLIKGLEKAKEVVEKEDLPEAEESECCEMSQDEIRDKIAKLQELLED